MMNRSLKIIAGAFVLMSFFISGNSTAYARSISETGLINSTTGDLKLSLGKIRS